MRILICAMEAPLAPLNGLRLQIRELARHLAAHHEVCVIAYRWPDQEEPPPDGVDLIALRPPPVRSRRDWAEAFARLEPVDAVRLPGPMRGAVRALRARRSFDVAHVTGAALAGVAPALREPADGAPALPVLIAPLDAWHLNLRAQADVATGARRRALLLHERLVRRYTARAYRPFAATVFVTEEDACEARRLDPSLRTAAIGNGVDTERFSPDPGVAADPGRILFTGALESPSNETAARLLATEVLPAVRARRPDAHLCLVGRAPGPGVRELGAHDGVEVVPDVPDLVPWLRSAEVYGCAMTSGTGIKNKLLEALAAGPPCVATPLACQGLAVADRRELLVAEPPAFADAVVELLADEALRRSLSAAGRRAVTEHHSWEAVADAYARLYEEIAT